MIHCCQHIELLFNLLNPPLLMSLGFKAHWLLANQLEQTE
ncbi:hypothetical protein Thiowin_01404 [Thiorhodovibrio winogradskyi]|uniref:Uncharacterized protein n=1 Tax=Thiorhodovibrio winogradskyi TaxID=77007 RepID=A0ABZ0SA57_9GAMM